MIVLFKRGVEMRKAGKKEYHDLTDIERQKIREYRKWCQSDAPHEYKMSMIESIYKTLKSLEIDHLI